MSALTRVERFDDLFPDIFRRFARPLRLADDAPGDIRLDVTENDRNYQVRAEIPGAKKEDIHVTVDRNFVSVSAEVTKEKEEKTGSRVVLKESYVGNLSRGFSVTHEIDATSVVAKLENGVLNITLPKLEGGVGRSIAVE